MEQISMDCGIQNEINQMPCYEVMYGKENMALDAMVGANWRCIDGRYKESGKLAFPGASLGFLMVSISAFYRLGFMDSAVQTKLIEIFEREMGPASFHSDNHNENSNFLCAGCGHVMLAHKNTGEYKMPTGWLENIHSRLSSENRTLLHGNHDERSVIIFEHATEVPLPSGMLVNGSAFVLHLGVASEVLRNLARVFIHEFNFTDAELMENALFESMKEHIALTSNALAKDLPKYTF